MGPAEDAACPFSGSYVTETGMQLLTMFKKDTRTFRIVDILRKRNAELLAPAKDIMCGLRALPNIATED